MKRSKFQTWFEAQYGTPPRKTRRQLSDDVRLAEDRLWRVRMELIERMRYDSRYDAAYKAWLAEKE